MYLPFDSVLENVRFLRTRVSKNWYFFVLEWTQDKNETHKNECLFKRKPMTVDAGGGGVLPIMAHTGRLHPKGVPFLVEVYQREAVKRVANF